MRIARTLAGTAAAAVLVACGTGTSPSPTADGTLDATSPSPTATATPTTTPSPSPTEEPTPTPTPESAFDDPQECENPELGYEVEYPGDWWANELIDPGEDDPGFTPIIACTFFAPEPIELQPNAGLPSGIAIQFDTADSVPTVSGEVLSEDTTTVDGREAVVREEQPEPQPGFVPEGSLVYRYSIELDDGRYLLASTDSILQDEAAYEESKDVLDAMMETIEVDD